MRWLAAAAVLAFACPAHALEIRTTEVAHSGGRYTIAFDVRIDAPTPAVRRLMTDYSRLSRLSDTVVDSEVLARGAGGQQRLRMRLKGCILFFCRTVHKVEDVATEANGDIVTRAVPGAGDFSYSVERWQILPEDNRTRIRYTGEMVPAFFVPPLIGPAIMKYKVRKELTEIVAKVERLSGRP